MNGISKSFGAKAVLTNLDLKIEDHDRIGLIGENGAGKSTLLNIIIGDLEYDTGTFAKGTGKKIGFLRQDSGLALGGTIISEMRSVFEPVLNAEKRIGELEHRMAVLEHGTEEYHNLLAEYEHEKNFFEANDGYNVSVKGFKIIGRVFNEFIFIRIYSARLVYVCHCLRKNHGADLFVDLRHDFGIVFEVRAHLIPAVGKPFPVIREPRAALFENPVRKPHIDDTPFARNAFAVDDIEFRLFERRR